MKYKDYVRQLYYLEQPFALETASAPLFGVYKHNLRAFVLIEYYVLEPPGFILGRGAALGKGSTLSNPLKDAVLENPAKGISPFGNPPILLSCIAFLFILIRRLL